MILALILLAIAASFVAILSVLGEAKAATGVGKILYVVMVVVTLLVSWTVTQIAFAFHYAHEYYVPRLGDRDAQSGLLFPKDEAPDYWDFFYFSTSIGATSQTSDVAIATKGLRRLVAIHAVISFFFNTMVLALMVNLAASLV